MYSKTSNARLNQVVVDDPLAINAGPASEAGQESKLSKRGCGRAFTLTPELFSNPGVLVSGNVLLVLPSVAMLVGLSCVMALTPIFLFKPHERRNVEGVRNSQIYFDLSSSMTHEIMASLRDGLSQRSSLNSFSK
jgi:hypothetical protein